MPKSNLLDQVVACSIWSATINDAGSVVVNYQKELVDDAPGTVNDATIPVGEAKVLTLNAEQSAEVVNAINGIIEDAINAAEEASGNTAISTADDTPGLESEAVG